MTQTINDLSRYQADRQTGSARWLYEFPNGHSVSVIPDPRPGQPFRFEIEHTGPTSESTTAPGLTTEQVETKLIEIYALPRAEPEPVMAWVTVDDEGKVVGEDAVNGGGDPIPQSTVTVGEFTWPVPERASNGTGIALSRIGTALREHGWRIIRGIDPSSDYDYTRWGYVGIPVEQLKED